MFYTLFEHLVLIELIIEALLLTKDYSPFDTHTQHTCLMFNERLIHLFDSTCLNVMCVCSTIYGSIQKFFDHFICFWKWFLSLFVFMFSAYFVFHCLNMLCVKKQVSEFFATQLATRQSWNPSRKFIQKLWRLTRDSLMTHSRLSKIFTSEPGDSPSRETPRISFLKRFFMGNLF